MGSISELVERASAGDLEAQSELVEPWLRPVVEWATRLGGPRLDSEDIAHEVFLTALGRLDRLREPERFGAWLYGITRNLVARHRRRAWLLRWVGASERDVADDAPRPDGVLENRESEARVERRLDRLSFKYREVLMLMVVEERTAPEVAQMLGVPEGTVRSRLRRAKEAYADVVRSDGPPGDDGVPGVPEEASS